MSKVYLLIDQALVSACNFTISIIISRFLGVEQLGVYMTGWIVLMFISSVMQAYLISPLISLYHTKDKKNKLLELNNTLVYLYIIGVIFFCIISELFYGFYGGFHLSFFVATYLLVEYARKVFLLISKYKAMLIMDIVSFFLGIALIVSLLLLDVKLSVFDIFIVQSFCFLCGFLYFSLNGAWSKFTTNGMALFEYIKENHKLGGWLFLSSITQWFGEPFYLMSAGYLMGVEALGVLRMVQNVVGLFNVLIQLLDSYMVVFLSKLLGKTNENIIKKHMTRYNVMVILLGGTALLLLPLTYHFVFNLLYGDVFSHMNTIRDILVIYVVLYMIQFLVLNQRAYLKVHKATRQIFKSTVLSMIISLVLFYPLIVFLGLNGVAIGVLISWISVFVYLQKAIYINEKKLSLLENA